MGRRKCQEARIARARWYYLPEIHVGQYVLHDKQRRGYIIDLPQEFF